MKKKDVLYKTNVTGNHPFARVWVLQCECGHVFGANSCDVHIRLCPRPECEGGAPGLPVPEQRK